MSEIIVGEEGNGGRDIKGSKPVNTSGKVTSAFPQSTSFPVKGMGNESANGGTVNTGRNGKLMSYEEYTGKKGTDGFSKTGGK